MKLSIIAAIGKNNELGKNNNLIWHLPGDLKFFKSVTNGKTVLMGKNTYESLPNLLPNRHHIVLTFTNEKYPESVEVYKDVNEFFNKHNNIDEEIFIIGGASIYNLFIDKCDTLYLTEIDKEDNTADVYFPNFNKDKYIKEELGNGNDSDINYKFIKYLRRK